MPIMDISSTGGVARSVVLHAQLLSLTPPLAGIEGPAFDFVCAHYSFLRRKPCGPGLHETACGDVRAYWVVCGSRLKRLVSCCLFECGEHSGIDDERGMIEGAASSEVQVLAKKVWAPGLEGWPIRLQFQESRFRSMTAKRAASRSNSAACFSSAATDAIRPGVFLWLLPVPQARDCQKR